MEPVPIEQRIAADGITVEFRETAPRPDFEQWVHRNYEVTFFLPDGSKMELPEGTQYGPDAGEPELAAVLSDALQAARDATNASSYEDWASEWAIEPSDWPPLSMYQAGIRAGEALREFLGEERYQAYLWETEWKR